MLTLLQHALQKKWLRSIDLHLAKYLIKDHSPALLLAVAWLSAQARQGDVCLLLSQMTQQQLFAGRDPQLAEACWQLAGNPTLEHWRALLSHSDAVSDGSINRPLILQSDRLYLQRLWQDECLVAQQLRHRSLGCFSLSVQFATHLSQLFPAKTDGVDWQKIAVAVAATRQFSVIAGGPGTGKTTTVAKLLIALINAHARPLRIILSAPTGKAAARMTEALNNALMRMNEQQMQLEAVTLHRLLGARGSSRQFRYHRHNPLHVDLLIIDEASMIDLTLMARLLEALPAHTRLILLGDKDQLASVEAGAVMGEICRFAQQPYSVVRVAELQQLTGFCLLDQGAGERGLQDNLCLLRHSYRFNAYSGIGQLALAVNQGKVSAAFSCFNGDFDDVTHFTLRDAAEYQQMLAYCVQGYQYYLKQLRHQGIAEALSALTHFQVLCGLREGAFGVSGLNQAIEQALLQGKKTSTWYQGRPIMVLRNAPQLGLYNGDIGITAMQAGKMMVFFKISHDIKAISPHRLPEHETAFALTVHKSQGSEFDHAVMVMPDSEVSVLSRELIYTAITRARSRFTLFGEMSLLQRAILNPVQRSSGLAARLAEAGE